MPPIGLTSIPLAPQPPLPQPPSPAAVRATEAPAVKAEKKTLRVPSVEIPWGRLARIAAILALVVGASLGVYAFYSTATAPGTLVLASSPSGAEVTIDGERRGTTPLRVALPPGEHQLAVRRGSAVQELTISINPGLETSQQIDLANIKPVGSLAVTSEPSGATVLVDGRNRGITPITISNLSEGTHKVVLESSAGSVSRAVTIKANAQASISEAIFSGWIAVFAPFELQIVANKRVIGTTESDRIMVPPGTYELELVNAALKFRQTRTVEVEPGKTAAVNIKSAEGMLRVRAPGGAEVLVDGQRVGEGPMVEARVAVGTRDVTVRHPQLGERRATATVTPTETAEISIDLPQ
jgi:hypothetical protein